MLVVIVKYLKLHVTDIIPNEKVKCSQEKIFFAEHFYLKITYILNEICVILRIPAIQIQHVIKSEDNINFVTKNCLA